VIQEKDGQYELRREFWHRFTSRADAERAERLVVEGHREIKLRIERAEKPCIAIREGVEDFLGYCQSVRGITSSTATDYRRRLERFAEMLPGLNGDVPLDGFGLPDLARYVSSRSDQVGPRTINAEIITLKAFATWAIRFGHVPDGITLHWREFEKVHEPPRKITWMQRDELERTIQRFEEVAPHVASLLWLLAYTGARPKALCSLRWENVKLPTDEECGVLELPPLKRGLPGSKVFQAESPIHRVLLFAKASAKRLHRRAGRSVRIRQHHPIFLNAHGKPWSQKVFSDAVRYHADRLGLEGFTAYVVRHSVVTHLKRLGLSANEIQHWAGHKLVTTQAAYDHTLGTDGQAAVDAASEAFGGGKITGASVPRSGALEALPLAPLERAGFNAVVSGDDEE